MSSSSSSTPEPLDPSFQIRLPAFEGPLDLLLHLIKKHELDVLDLPIAFVTERYLEYIGVMEKLSLDIASEYLVMAATLAYIKSRMLLPQDAVAEEEEAEEEEAGDPRAELIRRLLEYQKYKVAAAHLGGLGVTGRDVFLRGSDAPEASGPPPLAGMTLYKLLDAFQGVLKRAKAELVFAITTEGVSIQDRMRELTELLRARREVSFEDLFEGAATIYELVVTFLAILEMAKRRLVRVYQAEASSPIHLRSTVIDADAEDAPATDIANPEEAHVEPDEPRAASAPVEVVAEPVSAVGTLSAPDEAESVTEEARPETVETFSSEDEARPETVEAVSLQDERLPTAIETVSEQDEGLPEHVADPVAPGTEPEWQTVETVAMQSETIPEHAADPVAPGTEPKWQTVEPVPSDAGGASASEIGTPSSPDETLDSADGSGMQSAPAIGEDEPA